MNRAMRYTFVTCREFLLCGRTPLFACLLACILLATEASTAPKIMLISLDGATPWLVNQYLASGVLSRQEGVGLLQSRGIKALRNITVCPSLTAPGHIAIATGATAGANDIPANTFHLIASPFTSNISGFAAPIGGYLVGPPAAEDPTPTAEPIWVALRKAGKKVVTATWPGADGLDIRLPGSIPSPIIQSSSRRITDYTVPFGAFAGIGAQGFSLTAADFSEAPPTTMDQLTAAGHTSFSPVLQTTSPLETFTVGGVPYTVLVASLDTTDDQATNYDMLVFFDATSGIQPGPFTLPSTGPAYEQVDRTSSPFYLGGSANKAGTAYFVSALAPDLSTVCIARYAASSIPRNVPVIAAVDDINDNVGFWLPQPDFRIPERLSPGFGPFPDLELETMYRDQVRAFTDYQTRIALRAISQNSDADLVMSYFEQPDGAGHQFLLIDPRQPTDFTNPASIFDGQDSAKVIRYRNYLKEAYQAANQAVQAIIDAVGTDKRGEFNNNIFVVSDHGFAPFHTAVSINNLLASNGIDLTRMGAQVRAVTSGPAANVYINLEEREPGGTVTQREYIVLQQQVVEILKNFFDTNPPYTLGSPEVPVFDQVHTRPADLHDPDFGQTTNAFIGQDFGDVFAVLSLGYNFDGTQNPVVIRLGDPASTMPILSVPNFYGAHGYDPLLARMSAIFYAAGPDIGKGILPRARNVDIAPTITHLLGVPPALTVHGRVIDLTPQRHPHLPRR
jgi:predicted AlkP superfamily pyrophosphatase or phosphodiesterase